MKTKEIGRLTIGEFNKLYRHYQDDWDLEHELAYGRKTYSWARKQVRKDEEWDFD